MVVDSVEILEDVIKDELRRVAIRYYSVTHSREETITSCEGNLIVICNVLADYADLLDEFLKNDRERLGFCAVMQYERMRDRCRKITEDLQKKTGYDRVAAIEKCRRNIRSLRYGIPISLRDSLSGTTASGRAGKLPVLPAMTSCCMTGRKKGHRKERTDEVQVCKRNIS